MKTREQYGIYFDESSKGNVFVFTAAVVKLSRKNALDRGLRRIRQDMTSAVLRELPNLKTHPKLLNGKLLEIHAVDLFQSGGIFRDVKRRSPDFWPRQHEWLRQTLEIAAGYDVKYIYLTIDQDTLEDIRRNVGLPSDILHDFRFQSVKDRFDSLFLNPYFTALLGVMERVNNYLESVNGEGQLYCHTYDHATSYSTIESYETTRRLGHFSRLKQPIFKTCSEEQAIQCADAAGYLVLQAIHATRNKLPLKEVFQEWGRKYFLSQSQEIWPERDEEIHGPLGLIIFEMFAARSGGPDRFQKIVRDLMSEYIRQEPTKEPPMREFLQAALEIYDAETNKPPSEDGDLYG